MRASSTQALPITPDEILISNLYFNVVDYPYSESTSEIQPRVTIKLEAEMKTTDIKSKQKINIQTTISSRFYE
jgi:hypothetical protein